MLYGDDVGDGSSTLINEARHQMPSMAIFVTISRGILPLSKKMTVELPMHY